MGHNRLAGLDKLAAMPDYKVDYSDIPKTTDEAWKVADIENNNYQTIVES